MNVNPRVEKIILTQEKAIELLEKVDKKCQRRFSQRWGSFLMGIMKRGEWAGETMIKISSEDNLIDGQHRCYAVAKSGVSIEVVVCYDCKPETWRTTDQDAKPRTMNELLIATGERNTNRLASALRILHFFEDSGTANPRGASNYKGRASISQLFSVLDTHPEIRKSVSRAGASLRIPSVPGATISALHYLFTKSIFGPEAADTFFKRVKNLSFRQEGDSALIALAKYLSNLTTRPGALSISRVVVSAVVIKAWNFWVLGREIKLLKWVPGGVVNELFPHIEGLEYLKKEKEENENAE